MAMRKKTLRRLSPEARKIARLAGEATSLGRRLKNMVVEIQRLELDSQALRNSQGMEKQPQQEPIITLFEGGRIMNHSP